ncbi:hypothetical protein DCE79_05740 [Lysinibacillus sp. 2017]|nr:hypothetical protein DCE79_05740 [Lysinibacillus sp. 2017]TGN37142.1 hypothetical protein E4L99_01260 [Lysinibacillus sp. S2017]
MEFFVIFIVLPIVGVIWFLNLVTFIEKLHKGKNTHNQKVLGSVWTFLFIALLFYCLIWLIG